MRITDTIAALSAVLAREGNLEVTVPVGHGLGYSDALVSTEEVDRVQSVNGRSLYMGTFAGPDATPAMVVVFS